MTKTFKFYGVCNNLYKLNDVVWEAMEDESDGYRSYLESIVRVDGDRGIFFSSPLATVTVEKSTEYPDDGFKLVDIEDGHVWLEVGTDNYDDYYPCFRFEYHPKSPDQYEPKEALSDWELFYKGE